MRAMIHVAILAVFTSATACDGEGHDVVPVVVMTQNVYYGFDVGPILASQNPEEIPVLAAQAVQQVISANFPERAAAIAEEIDRKRPHLIGLQEVALFRIQSPGDAVAGGTTPAETVLFDYLEILLSALAARGLDYRVAGKVQNVDVEIPMVANPDPLAFDDVRLTDFDVVLARGDVAVSNVAAGNFQAKLPLENLGIEVPRGYVVVDADLGANRIVHFANAHLEDTPFLPVQLAQAQELAAVLSGKPHPVILVGDFNSPAPSGDTCQFLASQGYADVWTASPFREPGDGLTWGHASDLLNPAVQFTQRLDLVLIRDTRRLAPSTASVWGDELSERTSSGLWASDHAGVTAQLTYLRPRP
jgi:endonuclease/exonuclease/phosphatase family metal-dependent hydrolase